MARFAGGRGATTLSVQQSIVVRNWPAVVLVPARVSASAAERCKAAAISMSTPEARQRRSYGGSRPVAVKPRGVCWPWRSRCNNGGRRQIELGSGGLFLRRIRRRIQKYHGQRQRLSSLAGVMLGDHAGSSGTMTSGSEFERRLRLLIVGSVVNFPAPVDVVLKFRKRPLPTAGSPLLISTCADDAADRWTFWS